MRQGELDTARGQAKQLIKMFPDSPIGEILLGDVFMREKRFEDAINFYTRAFAKKEMSQIALKLYQARKEAGKNALGFIQEWVASHPTDRQAIKNLAESYSGMGRHNEAIKLYETLSENRPNDPLLLNNLALFYSQAGDLKTAIARASKALELAPNSAPIIDTLGWLWVQNGNPIRGLKLLWNAEIRAPKVPEITYHLSVALDALGQKKGARSKFRKALRSSRQFEGADDARAFLNRSGP